MCVLRNKRRLRLLLGTALGLAILPNQMAYQDLGALLAHRPEVAQRWRAYVFGAPPMRTARLDLPRPIGTAIPRPPLYVLASVNPNEIAGALGRQLLGDAHAPPQFPSVNRSGKGDALVNRPRAPMPPRAFTPDELVPEIDTEASFQELAALDVTKHDAIEQGDANSAVFFGAKLLDAPRRKLAPWAPGQAPEILSDLDTPGETIATKGIVTGPDQRPMSPAQRLKLSAAARAKAERCLANAVYFEARDEPVRAQVAVAQVVLNRVFSPYYPNNICDVVYQNAGRHLACQFTFACDGKSKAVTEPDAWDRAKKIAAETLDGKLWMPDVAKSTHYHDDWAHPNWVGEMRRLDKLGGLIFYRPRNWGDGSEEPTWGDPKTTAKSVSKL